MRSFNAFLHPIFLSDDPNEFEARDQEQKAVENHEQSIVEGVFCLIGGVFGGLFISFFGVSYFNDNRSTIRTALILCGWAVGRWSDAELAVVGVQVKGYASISVLRR
ncbi:MAG: YqhR family membrane protein [Rhizomicrobium sp.]